MQLSPWKSKRPETDCFSTNEGNIICKIMDSCSVDLIIKMCMKFEYACTCKKNCGETQQKQKQKQQLKFIYKINDTSMIVLKCNNILN